MDQVGYDGPLHFDAHAYRTEDLAGVRDFASGCMRTYLILKEKAERFNADSEIQALLDEINAEDEKTLPFLAGYTSQTSASLTDYHFDIATLGTRGLNYERLDQLLIDLLLGVR